MDSFTAYRASGEAAYRVFWSHKGPGFESDYAAGKAPRGPQKRAAPIHMGLSMWITEESARAKNDEFGGKLGDRVVLIELDGNLGIWWAQTFSPDHMTVWGRPEELERCIREIHPV
ncbi:MAG TPA: hypothetical protein VIL73_08030 [Gaiellaceae bacterium]